MEELEKRVEELERRVEKITMLQTHPAHGLSYDPLDHHLTQHKRLAEASARYDKSLKHLEEWLGRVENLVERIRLALLRFALADSLHNLLK